MKKLLVVLLAAVLALALPVLAFAKGENVLTEGWRNGYGEGPTAENENDTDGKFWRCEGINSPYGSPACNIYKAVKAILGDREICEVIVGYDIRADLKEGTESVDINTTIRAGRITKAASEAIKEGTLFDVYDGEVMQQNGDQLYNNTFDEGLITVDKTWQHHELVLNIYKSDVNDLLWKQWDFCWDGMENYANINALEIRNMEVCEGEAVATPAPTPEPTAVPTEAPATEAPATDAPTAAPIDKPEEKTGCGSVLSLGLIALLPAVIVLKKKH